MPELLSSAKLTRLEGLLGKKKTSLSSRITPSKPSFWLRRRRTFPRPGDTPSEVEPPILVGLSWFRSLDLDHCTHGRPRRCQLATRQIGDFLLPGSVVVMFLELTARLEAFWGLKAYSSHYEDLFLILLVLSDGATGAEFRMFEKAVIGEMACDPLLNTLLISKRAFWCSKTSRVRRV